MIYDVLEKYEKDHILMKITIEEALKELVELNKLKDFIKKVKNNITHNELKKISPFAVPIVMEFYTERISKDKILSYEEENIEKVLIKEAYKIEQDNIC